MIDFALHTLESAQEDSKDLMEKVIKITGKYPNLHGVMAESPQFYKAYMRINKLYLETSLTTIEKNVVWLSIVVARGCSYGVAGHTSVALLQEVDPEIIDAIRKDIPLKDAKLESLRKFAQHLVENHGEIDDKALQAFIDAGYTNQNLLDVLLGFTQKVMSTYLNRITEIPLDEDLEKYDWSPSERLNP